MRSGYGLRWCFSCVSYTLATKTCKESNTYSPLNSTHELGMPSTIILSRTMIVLLKLLLLVMPINTSNAFTSLGCSSGNICTTAKIDDAIQQHRSIFIYPAKICTSRLQAKSSTSEASKISSSTVDLTSLRKLVSEATKLHSKNLSSNNNILSIAQLSQRIIDLQTESSDPTFWDASNSNRNEVVTRDLARYSKLKEQLETWEKLRSGAEDALELLEELMGDNGDTNAKGSSEEDDEMIQLTMDECYTSATQLFESSQKYELTTLLSGPYDDCSSCRIILTAGAGGTEACDWVSMLYRMYTRHAGYLDDFKVTTIDESQGDVVGYKSVELLVDGSNAYGWFKGEKGAHRLVRLSPFNANNKRQTTFAGVDVIPILDDKIIKHVDVPDKELEVTTMRSGGKGGQNVNKVETGVRIKHIPSGIAVKCTQERSQNMNKQLAMQRLKAQLVAIAQEEQLSNINAIRGDVVEASWGAQIRNYVMQPYKMVKDARSSYETSDVDGVLDGGKALEEFIGAYLRWKRGEEEKVREEQELHARV